MCQAVCGRGNSQRRKSKQVSGSDRRLNALMQFLVKYGSELIVFCMCHLAKDTRRIMNAIVLRSLSTFIPTQFCRRLLSNTAPSVVAKQIQLSNTCINRLKEICKDETFLRVSVEGGGCSGFQYKFSIDQHLTDDDTVLRRDGVQVAIDNASIDFLGGATIDYHTELIRSGFRIINNPKAEQGCSCGASFAVKID